MQEREGDSSREERSGSRRGDGAIYQASFCADRLKVLGDPLRLRIVNLLQTDELTVGDICEFLEAEIGTASHHLKILKHGKPVSPRRICRFIYDRLCDGLFKKCSASRPVLDPGCCTRGLFRHVGRNLQHAGSGLTASGFDQRSVSSPPVRMSGLDADLPTQWKELMRLFKGFQADVTKTLDCVTLLSKRQSCLKLYGERFLCQSAIRRSIRRKSRENNR